MDQPAALDVQCGRRGPYRDHSGRELPLVAGQMQHAERERGAERAGRAICPTR